MGLGSGVQPVLGSVRLDARRPTPDTNLKSPKSPIANRQPLIANRLPQHSALIARHLRAEHRTPNARMHSLSSGGGLSVQRTGEGVEHEPARAQRGPHPPPQHRYTVTPTTVRNTESRTPECIPSPLGEGCECSEQGRGLKTNPP